jgi:hypothetical protein
MLFIIIRLVLLTRRGVSLYLFWCGWGDSNSHALAGTSTSSLRVYQFHHNRNISFYFGISFDLESSTGLTTGATGAV